MPLKVRAASPPLHGTSSSTLVKPVSGVCVLPISIKRGRTERSSCELNHKKGLSRCTCCARCPTHSIATTLSSEVSWQPSDRGRSSQQSHVEWKQMSRWDWTSSAQTWRTTAQPARMLGDQQRPTLLSCRGEALRIGCICHACQWLSVVHAYHISCPV